MAIINKTGITNGGTIQAEHITRVIDALSGVSTDSLILTGSMTGSLIGTLTGTASFATSASRAVSSSFAISSSFATSASRAVSSSFATTASFALNAVGGGSEYMTISLIHLTQTGTTTGTVSAFGPFASRTAAEGDIFAHVPYDCRIVSASVTTHCSVPGTTAANNYSLAWYDGASYSSSSLGKIDLTTPSPTFTAENARDVNVTISAGRQIYGKMEAISTDASVEFVSNINVLIVKV
jgi:hypothetical protein